MGEMQRIQSFIKGKLVARRSVIAMMGLPWTRKSAVAEQIGEWAKCPVLFIDDSIVDGDEAEEEDVAGDWEEAERLQVNVLQRAFTTLCRVANRHLSERFPVVVIKSRLCSTFELRKLMQLVSKKQGVLLIVECQMRNKHQWHRHFNEDYFYSSKWYRPRSWNDIEKARDDHFDPQARADWDRRLLHLIQRYPDARVRRLVVDPYNDLDLTELTAYDIEINPIFCLAINYLLSAEPCEELNYQNPNVVDLDKFRRSREEQVLNALPSSSTRSDDLCGGEGCLFRYWEELPATGDQGSCCGVCGEGLVSGKPAYTCYYCILTLHQSCAQMIHFNFLNICEHLRTYLREYIYESDHEKHIAYNAN